MLIESALWNAINVAQTGRKLGINSDARYRFERGVDPGGLAPRLIRILEGERRPQRAEALREIAELRPIDLSAAGDGGGRRACDRLDARHERAR